MTPESPEATQETADETTDETADEATAGSIPASMHATVFFRTERGNEHLDVHVTSDATTTAISGVRADESRAHPATVRIELSPSQRTEYVARIAALSEIPRCEPLAVLADEPMFNIESDGFTGGGPSLWLRETGAELLASDDPCLGFVRLAHFIYATWMNHDASR